MEITIIENKYCIIPLGTRSVISCHAEASRQVQR